MQLLCIDKFKSAGGSYNDPEEEVSSEEEEEPEPEIDPSMFDIQGFVFKNRAGTRSWPHVDAPARAPPPPRELGFYADSPLHECSKLHGYRFENPIYIRLCGVITVTRTQITFFNQSWRDLYTRVTVRR